MKKIILSLLLICALLTVAVSAAEATNLVDEKNAGFEGVTDIKDSKWFRLINSNGENGGAGIKQGISIKTDGGHTGSNYVSVECESSWYSPSINIFPFIKAAGAGDYVISFWIRMSEGAKLPSQLLVRATAKDVVEEGGIYITNRNNGNNFATIPATYEAEENGWSLFVSETISIDASEIAKNHSWWLCMDSLSGTMDVDDFAITRDEDFELPDLPDVVITPEPKANTELSYLTEEVKNNALDASKASTPAATAEPTAVPEPTADPDVKSDKNGLSGGLTALLGGGAFVLFAALGAGFVLLKKK